MKTSGMAESSSCDSRDVAVKSFFLGPQAENGEWFSKLLSGLLRGWLGWRRERFPLDGSAISESDRDGTEFRETQVRFAELASELSARFSEEIPKFSPRYLGHMFSELSLPALLGHWIATLHNPNIVSSESAPVGVEIEREAIQMLAEMIGFARTAPGHFTSCGTIANLEAALRARDRGLSRNSAATPAILVPENAHYSWEKAAHLLGLGARGIVRVALDEKGRLDPRDLAVKLAGLGRSRSALVVSVLGTTELGNFDPVDETAVVIASHRARGQDIWHHVDAAFGGFFLSLKTSELFSVAARRALAAVAQADSITIDPHKLGYVPYACGAFICRDLDHYATQSFVSPYIHHAGAREPGPYTIEGSRSASGAAATWLTLKAIGAGEGGGYGRIVGRSIQLSRELAKRLSEVDARVRVLPDQDSNMLCFTVGARGGSLVSANEWVLKFFEAHSKPGAAYFVSKTALSVSSYRKLCGRLFEGWAPEVDAEELYLIRLTLMNPFIRSKEMRVDILEQFCREVAAYLPPQ